MSKAHPCITVHDRGERSRGDSARPEADDSNRKITPSMGTKVAFYEALPLARSAVGSVMGDEPGNPRDIPYCRYVNQLYVPGTWFTTALLLLYVVVWQNKLALKLAGVVSLWGRLCLRCRARGPREPPLPFSSLDLLARAGVPGAGGISVECLRGI